MVQFRGFETKDAATRFQEVNGGLLCYAERKPRAGRLTTRGECYMDLVINGGLDMEQYPYCVEWIGDGKSIVEHGPQSEQIEHTERGWKIGYTLYSETTRISEWMYLRAAGSTEAVEIASSELDSKATNWPMWWRILDVQMV